MITLNLLPKTKKAELGLMQFYITLKNIIILILIITILIAISLLSTKMALQNHFNEIVAQSTLNNKYASSFNQGVQAFNKKLNAVEKIQSDYIVWTNFLSTMANLVPQDIVLYSVEINSKKIILSGMSKDRDSLLKFSENLKSSGVFTNVETPLENLLKRTDIDFNIRADVDLKKF